MTKNDLFAAPLPQDGRILVSYPKSGRTWIDFAMKSQGIDVALTHAGCSTNRREIGRPFVGISPQLAGLPLAFLHRNPVDTAVSLFHHVTHRDLKRGTSRYARMFLPLLMRGALPPRDIDSFVLHPTHGIEKICRFNRAWLDDLSGRSGCLVLTYEQMRKDPATGFQTLLDFFRVTGVTGDQLARASDFDRMKKAEQTERRKPDDPGRKVRKGKVGGYVDELRPETVAACHMVMARSGFAP